MISPDPPQPLLTVVDNGQASAADSAVAGADTIRYSVAVRTLCEFTAKGGDLDIRFTPSPSALEGMAGHGVVTSRRGPGYQSEVSLSGSFGALHVRGRADGYDPARNLLEEIKTVRGEARPVPDNHQRLHLAQAKVYGWLQCERLGLGEIDVAVVYLDILTQRERTVRERFEAAALRAHFEDLCGRFLHWARQELAHRAARDAGLAALAFPHEAFRPGQRELAEAVYKANLSGRCLLAQAPTGIGKSVGTMFPALKAMPGKKIDKLFFLSARSTGRAIALDAIARLRPCVGLPGSEAPLRVLDLVARDKACEYPGQACHGDACPLARGFYDRLPAARDAAVALPVLDRPALRAVALAHGVCPYYLGQEMARWSDVVVADYNYYFDRGALLFMLTLGNGWCVSVLVDEAHNLVERGRGMYSAEIDQHALRGVRHAAPPSLAKPLSHLSRQWNALVREQDEGYRAYDKVPPKFVDALEQAGAAILETLSDPAGHDPTLQQFYFDALQFCRMAEQLDSHSLFDITKGDGPRGGATLCVRNLIPAPFLRPRLAASHTTVLFSATLGPSQYYNDMLGMPERSAWVEVASPFDATQLKVHVAGHISTRYAERERSLPDIVALIGGAYAEVPGNYLAFFSSHAYLQQAATLFAREFPGVPVWAQARGMNEAAQASFLGAFVPGGQGIGFAVLGGAFSEGVDLPGDRLIGAFVATLGLPQVNEINEQLRARMEQMFGQGYEYAYLYPGLRKVVQAAGRVIRTRQDRGVIHLIDDRFARPAVRALLPGWWKIG